MKCAHRKWPGEVFCYQKNVTQITHTLINQCERGGQRKPLERKLHWILDLVLLLQRDEWRYWDKSGTGPFYRIREMTFLTEQHRCLILVIWVHENEVTREHTGSVFTSE